MERNISNKFTVSEHTAGWASLRNAIEQLWGDIYELIELEEVDFEKRFEEEFEHPLLDLTEAIENGLAQSVLTSMREHKQSTVL